MKMFHKAIEKINTNILCSTKNFSQNRTVYLIRWEKYGGAGEATDDNTVRRMRFACWINNTTIALGMCSTYCFSATKIILRKLLNITLLLLQFL